MDDALLEHHPYRPYGAAVELFRFGTAKCLYQGSEIVLSGGAGTGKSRVCLEKLHACATKYSGFRGLIIRQTRSSLTDTGLVTYEDHVLPVGSRIKSGPARENRHSYKYPNGSEIVVGGLEDIQRIMSGEYDLIFCQEATEVTEEQWEMLTTRLRGKAMPYQVIIGDCNPSTPTHWLRRRAAEGKLHLLDTTHQDNPQYYDHDKGEWTELGRKYLSTLEKLTGHRLARYRYGKWVTVEGARWPQLDDNIHRFHASSKWPDGLPESHYIILGLDWGLKAPYCALWLAIDHDGDLWVFREDYKAGLTTDLQAQEVVSLTRENEIIRYAYADPAMWAKTQTHTGKVAKSDADFYNKAFSDDNKRRESQGLRPRFGQLIKGYNSRRTIALSTIDSLLNRENGYANLHIEYGCVNLWRELCDAVWDKNAERNEGIDPKCDDHAITALYYACHTYIEAPSATKDHWPTQEEQRRILNEKNIQEEKRSFEQRYNRRASNY